MNSVVEADPRISRRRKAVARSKRKRLFLGLALLAGLITVIYAMFWSPLLEVREVKVVGGPHTSSEQVATVAGLDQGGNLLRLSTREVADRVETLPWVKSAEVTRMLPGTVKVRVVEREPALVLSLAGSRWLIDATGAVLDSGSTRGLPVLAGVEVGGVSPGDELKTEEALDALSAFRSLSGPLQDKVAGMFAPTRERITLSLDDGTVIRYGAAERLVAKNRVLGALLERFREEGRSVGYIDVRVPTNPAVAPAAPEGQEPPAAP